jgi:hypothetical protein
MSKKSESSCLGFKEVGGAVLWECCAISLKRRGREEGIYRAVAGGSGRFP